MLRNLLLTLVLVSACTLSDSVELGSGEQYGQDLNGQDLNGQDLNGQDLNGQDLNGSTANYAVWVSLDNVVLDGVTLDSTTLSGTVFTGTSGSTTHTGGDMAGALFQGWRNNNTWVTLRLTSAVAPVAPATAWFYKVDFLGPNGQWAPACRNASGIHTSVPLEGTWVYAIGPDGGTHVDSVGKFTFSCEKMGALAKCVQAGYEPWASETLAAHHQACTRMIRADYCGDGTSYTTNGRLLNLYDNIGVQIDTEITWGPEAEWDTHSARCITSHHRASVEIPCYDPALEADCGNPDVMQDHYAAGTLIVDELP